MDWLIFYKSKMPTTNTTVAILPIGTCDSEADDVTSVIQRMKMIQIMSLQPTKIYCHL